MAESNISEHESKELERIMKAFPWDLTPEEREIQLSINKVTIRKLREILCNTLKMKCNE